MSKHKERLKSFLDLPDEEFDALLEKIQNMEKRIDIETIKRDIDEAIQIYGKRIGE